MNDRLSKILNHPLTIPVSVGVVSFGIGFGLGHILKRKEVKEIHELPEQTKFDYEGIEEFLSKHEEKLETTGEKFVSNKLKKEVIIMPKEEVEEPVTHSIFAGTNTEWNYNEELKKRSTSEPYVLHRDEFYAAEMDYSQITLTYYAGDNIMVDEDDAPIYNYDTIVGPLLFGHGSDDPNVFHVRNDARKAEYEILHDQGYYSREVLGLDIEDGERAKDLKHSSGVRKFKMD
jgi:hypothetical protein